MFGSVVEVVECCELSGCVSVAGTFAAVFLSELERPGREGGSHGKRQRGISIYGNTGITRYRCSESTPRRTLCNGVSRRMGEGRTLTGTLRGAGTALASCPCSRTGSRTTASRSSQRVLLPVSTTTTTHGHTLTSDEAPSKVDPVQVVLFRIHVSATLRQHMSRGVCICAAGTHAICPMLFEIAYSRLLLMSSALNSRLPRPLWNTFPNELAIIVDLSPSLL